MQQIILATANEGKVREFGEMFSSLPVKLSSIKDHWDPVPLIEETGDTFYANAKLKADWVFGESSGIWALADDSGLEVDALGGAPGVHSARFAGDNAGGQDNITKLLTLLNGTPREKRGARFRCTLVLKIAPQRYITTEGTCEGEIAYAQRGGGGFGYDPVFIPRGMDTTFASIDPMVKHGISHRGRALKELVRELHELLKSAG